MCSALQLEASSAQLPLLQQQVGSLEKQLQQAQASLSAALQALGLDANGVSDPNAPAKQVG